MPYDPDWPSLFAAEAAALRAVLGPWCRGIEHVGSTAVPGLAAKPVLDISIEVESFRQLEAVVRGLADLGYDHKGEFGLPGRQFFGKGDPVTHHVHAVETGSTHLNAWLGFRDALRRDARLRAAYTTCKQELLAKFAHDRASYTAGKSAFVESVLQQVRP